MPTRTCPWVRLVAAWSVEIQTHLSDAVVRWWANAGRLGPPIPSVQPCQQRLGAVGRSRRRASEA
eukprot:14807497-Alexandrium_andersonii.AAC.1